MSALDIILAVAFVMGMSSGYQKGFLVTFFSLLAIFLGILAGFKLMGVAMLTLHNYYKIDEKILPYAAFGVVFVIVLILVNAVGDMLKSTLHKTILGSADQFAGAVMGLFKTAFMVSVIFWIMSSMDLKFFHRFTEHSFLYPYTAGFAPAVTAWAGEIFPAAGELFRQHE
jgi:membrane protein required for colicin V production